MGAQFKHDDFQFGFEIALGAAYHGASDAGEVLATAARVKDGDADAWLAEWTATADAVRSQAEAAEAAGHRVSALAHYRRAATYYSTALYLLDHAKHQEAGSDTWHTQRACWQKVVDLSPVPGERVAIAYEDTELEAFFFRAPDAEPGEPRPLVVVNNGSDGATSGMWSDGGAAASERGYHWMTFDGPGQQSTWFEKGIPFRPDWEAVLGPVADAMTARDDVDSDRMAVIGVSQAGFWVPRALAFEHRFAAAVADPGVVDVSTSWTEQLPGFMTKQLDQGDRRTSTRRWAWSRRSRTSTHATLEFRGRPYGLDTDSRFDLYKAVRQYVLGDEVGQITTPMLITDPRTSSSGPASPSSCTTCCPGTRSW